MKHCFWALALVVAVGLLGCGQSAENGPEPAETAAEPTATSETAESSEPAKIEGDALAEMLADDNVFLLDVRNPEELEEYGTVEGYVNIPIEQLADRLDELPKDRPILTA